MAEDKATAADEGHDDLQERFRAALERKKNAQHSSGDSSRNEGKSAGPSQAKVKRQFRRKSG